MKIQVVFCSLASRTNVWCASSNSVTNFTNVNNNGNPNNNNANNANAAAP